MFKNILKINCKESPPYFSSGEEFAKKDLKLFFRYCIIYLKNKESKMEKYKTKKGIVYKNQFHIIWTVKYRKKLLVEKIEERLKEIIFEVCEEKEVDLKAIEVMPDHVHIFIDVVPRQPLHLLVKAFKGRTSNKLRKEFKILTTRVPSLWTRSYFCCTVGNISEDVIQKYIENQKNK